MEQRNAEPVDRKRFQVRGAAITKLFQAPIDPHLEPWQVHVHLFAMNRMSVHDSFCNSTVFAPEASAESFGTEDEPNKGSGLILEIFAGSCRFSKACKNLGFRVLAVDKNPKRAENFPVASFDLTRPHDFSTVCKFAEAESEDLLLAHFAPSCGTASKARERKVPGIPNPPRPLRSESYPDGLAGLTEQEHQRVLEANASYSAMVELICFSLG